QQGFIKRSALAGTAQIPRKVPLLMISSLRIDGKDYLAKDEPTDSRVTPEKEAATQSITLKLSSRRQYRLETGPLGAVFKAMRQCTTNLVKSWGFDPDVQANLTKFAEPTGTPERWFTANDYPSGALQNGQSGSLIFRLDVNETGKVDGCRVLYRTNPDEFATLTCKLLLRRATMSPALDSQNRPVRSFYIRKIKWLAG
ncbi:MAG: energy transducer TonB, partial [Sphingomonas sp.]|nr:energy transducer TonB [Sphingomonas sp.]